MEIFNKNNTRHVLICNGSLLTENGDLSTKTNALKKVIQLILNGERLPGILMTVIRFVMPLEVSSSKRMLIHLKFIIYWP